MVKTTVAIGIDEEIMNKKVARTLCVPTYGKFNIVYPSDERCIEAVITKGVDA